VYENSKHKKWRKRLLGEKVEFDSDNLLSRLLGKTVASVNERFRAEIGLPSLRAVLAETSAGEKSA
jgi:hypothetical protein